MCQTIWPDTWDMQKAMYQFLTEIIYNTIYIIVKLVIIIV